MVKIEVTFEGILPRVAYFISILYRIKIDGRDVPGAVKIDFHDSFLSKYRAGPIGGPDPVKFSDANQALLTEIGRLRIKIAMQKLTADDIIRHCAGLGKESLEILTNDAFTDSTLDDLVERLRGEADARPPIGFRP